MTPGNLHQTAAQFNRPEQARLFAILNHLPPEARAEVYLGIVAQLADRLDSAPRVDR